MEIYISEVERRLLCLLLSVVLFQAMAAQTPCDHSLGFYGVSSSIDAGPSSTYFFENQITVEAWVKLNDVVRLQKIVTNLDTSQVSGFELAVQNSHIFCTVKDTLGSITAFNVGTVPVQQWTHLAFTHRVGGRFAAYINGQLVINGYGRPNPVDNRSPLHMTLGSDALSPDSSTVDGLMDEVRIYNTARTAADIRRDMRLQLTNFPQSGLIAYWKFTEGTGTVVQDFSGQNHTGAFQGSAPPVWQSETGPYGVGRADIAPLASTGLLSYPNEHLDLTVNAYTMGDTLVVSELDCSPLVLPLGNAQWTNGYWILDRYGAGTNFDVQAEFRLPSGSVSLNDEQSPGNLKLHHRPAFSVGAWSEIDSASTASASQAMVRFDSVSQAGQFMIGTTGSSWLDVHEAAESFLSVYPQPATSGLHLRFLNASDNHEVTLFSMQGQKIDKYLFEGETAWFPLVDYPAGFYILHVRSGKHCLRRKISVHSD